MEKKLIITSWSKISECINKSKWSSFYEFCSYESSMAIKKELEVI